MRQSRNTIEYVDIRKITVQFVAFFTFLMYKLFTEFWKL